MKIFVIVIDGFGIGAAPDADRFGDAQANTYRTVLETGMLDLPFLTSMGFQNIEGIVQAQPQRCPCGAFGRMQELSAGKDTTTGHYEISGLVVQNPFPIFEHFPAEILQRIEKRARVKFIGNYPESGTVIIQKLGQEHLDTGCPILYTSADSVFQVAAHVDRIPLPELYRICTIAREELVGEYAVGRVIARPFGGTTHFERIAAGRRDFSLPPPAPLMTDRVKAAGLDSIGVGKIEDIVGKSGLTESYHTITNAEGLHQLAELNLRTINGLIFCNLVETDSKFGHRNDAEGYAKALNEIDIALKNMYAVADFETVFIVTADHGCDPQAPGTDHTREFVPLLIYGKNVCTVDLKTRMGFMTVSDTVMDLLLGVAGDQSVKSKIWEKG